jgi:hypothetical protein
VKLPPTVPLRGDWAADKQSVLDQFARIANANNNPDKGTTAARPTIQLTIGQTYFDTTLGRPVWWRGAAWVDATGAVV